MNQAAVVLLSTLGRDGQVPFEVGRAEVVSTLNDLMPLLSTYNDDKVRAVFFSQTLTLSQLNEARPQRLSDLHRLRGNGHVLLGPWYTVPSTLLPDGEALIRNLQAGIQVLRRLELPVDQLLAVVSDNAFQQLPQLLNGFGLNTFLRISDSAREPLWWHAVDGSKILKFDLHIPAGTPPVDGEFFGNPFVDRKFRRSVDLDQTVSSSPILFYQTADSLLRDIRDGQFAGRKSAVSRQPKSRSASVANILDYSRYFSQPELGDYDRQRLNYSPSTMVELRQLDFESQIELRLWAEPFAVWSAQVVAQTESSSEVSGRFGMAPSLLDRAWHLALQNHSPSILGGHCVPVVRDEAVTRFRGALQLATWLADGALVKISSLIETRKRRMSVEHSAIVVFNPSHVPRSEIIRIQLGDDAESIPGVVGSDGRSLATVLTDHQGDTELQRAKNYPSLRFLATDVPPQGYRTYYLEADSHEVEPEVIDDGNVIENQFLAVELNQADGTLTLFDKRTGRRFDGLNRYIDDGDAGDTGNHLGPAHDTPISIATNTPIFVERTLSSIDQSLRFLQIFRIPISLTPDGNARRPLAAQFVPLSVITTVRLVAGSGRLDIECSVSDSARDHRMRVHFAFGPALERMFVDSKFSVESFGVETEPDDGTLFSGIQGAFTTLLGPDTGLTLSSQGVPVVDVYRSGDMYSMALTLFRNVRRETPEESSTVLRQDNSQGATPVLSLDVDYNFSYSLIPHDQVPDAAWREARAVQSGLRAVLANSKQKGPLPNELSFLTADHPDFVITSVKPCAERSGFVVRGFNCGQSEIEVNLALGLGAHRSRFVHLDETNASNRTLKLVDGHVTFAAQPGKIISILFE